MTEDKMTQIVDEFVDQYYGGDYEIVALSSTRNDLSAVLSLYVQEKSECTPNSERTIRELAKRVLLIITNLRSRGLITESMSMTTKLNKAVELIKEGDDETALLREQNEKLRKEVERLKKLNEALH